MVKPLRRSARREAALLLGSSLRRRPDEARQLLEPALFSRCVRSAAVTAITPKNRRLFLYLPFDSFEIFAESRLIFGSGEEPTACLLPVLSNGRVETAFRRLILPGVGRLLRGPVSLTCPARV